LPNTEKSAFGGRPFLKVNSNADSWSMVMDFATGGGISIILMYLAFIASISELSRYVISSFILWSSTRPTLRTGVFRRDGYGPGAGAAAAAGAAAGGAAFGQGSKLQRHLAVAWNKFIFPRNMMFGGFPLIIICAVATAQSAVVSVANPR
jgi:hypothetical protein